MRPARACAQTQSFVTPSRSATSSAVSRLVTVARSSFKPAAALPVELPLQPPLRSLNFHLSDSVFGFASGDERSLAVAALCLLAAQVLEVVCGEGLGAMQLGELAAPPGEPAPA